MSPAALRVGLNLRQNSELVIVARAEDLHIDSGYKLFELSFAQSVLMSRDVVGLKSI